MKTETKHSPRLPWLLLRLLLIDKDRSAILGDFEEQYLNIYRSKGRFLAFLWYWGNVFKSLPSMLFLKFYWNCIMLLNNFKVMIRNMKRQKYYSLINIIGLAVGLACTFIILLWVFDEISYDRFHKNEENIYQVICIWKDGTSSASVPGRLAKTVKEKIPEVVLATRFMKGNRVVMRYKNKAFYEDGLVSVDPDFFNIFSFKLLYGDPKSILRDPHDMIVTEPLAKKYFGDEDPVGKILNWNNWQEYQVKGIIEDIPFHSSIQLNFIESHLMGEKYWKNGYTWFNFVHHTYLQLLPGADIPVIEEKMTDILRNNNPDIFSYLDRLSLQPLTEMHLNAGIAGVQYQTTPKKYVTIFSTIALFILFIACINFVNLSTARAAQRAKEVGLRKVVGSSRGALIRQFFFESLCYTFIAGILAVIITRLVLRDFERMFGLPILGGTSPSQLILGLFGALILTGITAGTYPALVLSSFRPLQMLKGFAAKGKGKHALRKVLVVFQFVISVFLITGTIVVIKQLHFIKEQDMGFDQENIVYIPLKEEVGRQYAVFKQTLLSHSNIMGVTAKSFLPMVSYNNLNLVWEGGDPEINFSIEDNDIDIDYIKTVGLEIVEGRDFSKEISTDAQDAVILNEEAVRGMNLEDPVGKWIFTGSRKLYIIGIVRNEKYQTAMVPPLARMYTLNSDWADNSSNLMGVVLIKIKESGTEIGMDAAIGNIKETWEKLNPQYPFEFHFLDQDVEKLYLDVKIFIKLMTYFTLIAIFISCMGLFGLASYTMETRTKEIGVRKVVGASMFRLMLMLSKEFFQWIIIANLIAWPSAYLIMNRWLQDFAVRISLDFSIFLFSGLAAAVTAFVSVGLQILRGARINCAEALRYE